MLLATMTTVVVSVSGACSLLGSRADRLSTGLSVSRADRHWFPQSVTMLKSLRKTEVSMNDFNGQSRRIKRILRIRISRSDAVKGNRLFYLGITEPGPHQRRKVKRLGGGPCGDIRRKTNSHSGRARTFTFEMLISALLLAYGQGWRGPS